MEVEKGSSCLSYVPPNVTLINNPQLMLEMGNHLVGTRDHKSLMCFSLHELQAKLTALLIHAQVTEAVLGTKCKDADNRAKRSEQEADEKLCMERRHMKTLGIIYRRPKLPLMI